MAITLQFCIENFLSHKALEFMANTKRQLLDILSDQEFVQPGLHAKDVQKLGKTYGSDGVQKALEEGTGTEGSVGAPEYYMKGKKAPVPKGKKAIKPEPKKKGKKDVAIFLCATACICSGELLVQETSYASHSGELLVQETSYASQ